MSNKATKPILLACVSSKEQEKGSFYTSISQKINYSYDDISGILASYQF